MAIAGVNGPDLTVVSGLNRDVAAVLEASQRLGMTSRLLPVSLTFHSPAMDPVLDSFTAYAARFTGRPPRLDWISTVTGQAIPEEPAVDAGYWRRQIREPVRWWMAMVTLTQSGPRTFLEIGPGRTLLNMAREAIDPEGHAWFPSLNRHGHDRQVLLETALGLWQRGAAVNLSAVISDLG